MSLDFSRCRLQPFQHQREDVAWLIERPFAFIASEMRTGKSKIVIDAAQFLYEARVIDCVIVVAPAPVRDVWYDPTLGEVAKHAWEDMPNKVVEYHARLRTWSNIACPSNSAPSKERLTWYVTNYEFLRSKARLTQLFAVAGPKTLLVLDESSFVKNHAAQQTKACLQLRRACGRVVLLNGTPIFHSPMDLFSQGNILHPSILDCKFVTLYRARYAVQKPVLGHGGKPLANPRGGGPILQTVGWTNLDDLQRRFAPYTVRRLQAECLDLPPKLDPVTLTATLTPETWRAYRDMRDELVVWLNQSSVATSATAAVKALRLSQITGGFIGGVEDANIEPVDVGLLESIDLPGSFLDGLKLQPEGAAALRGQTRHFNGGIDERVRDDAEGVSAVRQTVGTDQRNAEGDLEKAGGHRRPDPAGPQELITTVGHEKLDVLLWFIGQRLEEDPCLHLVAWCRFRAELLRMVNVVHSQFPQFECGVIMGGQAKKGRLAALALLKPETSPVGPVFVGGIEGTGSFGLDMCAAHTCVTMSSGYSPGRSAQTLDRLYGPGQKFPIAYYDVIAVGPKNQRTIDHDILVARRSGEDVATRTSAAWVKALQEE